MDRLKQVNPLTQWGNLIKREGNLVDATDFFLQIMTDNKLKKFFTEVRTFNALGRTNTNDDLYE
jgi:hypothetical protein